MKKFYPKILLTFFLLLAFGLRFYKIGEHGLAGDEKYSLFVSQFVTYEGNNQHNSVRKTDSKYFTPKEFWSEKSLPDFFDSIARLDTGNGALYTYTLHFWSSIFGVSDTSFRMLSLLFNLLTISLLYVFIKANFRSENLALLAVFLASISPFFIAFSQVARNYSMLMFFALLATHLLLKIIQKEEKNEKVAAWNYVFYGLCALACEMCHFSTFPLFLIHGLFVLLYFRKNRGYFGLILAMIIPVLGVIFWIKSDGGKWIFDYIHNSTKVYNATASSHPDEFLSLATPKNILLQLRHVISSIFLISDGLYLQLSGVKNTLISVAMGLLSILFYQFIKFQKLRIALFLSALLALFLLISTSKFYFLVFSADIFLVYFYVKSVYQMTDKHEKKMRVFLILLAVIPISSLAVFAWQDGNTFRIIPRYIAYSYSFNLILISLIIKDLWQNNDWIKYPIFGILFFQLFNICGIIQSIYEDKSPRYFMNFVEPRKPNPYQFAAQKIEQMYAKGDTVIYPSTFIEKSGGIAMPKYSVVDAQLTNFYLPKTAEIIQRVEPNEPNKIILKKNNGQAILIFNFEGTKYRY